MNACQMICHLTDSFKTATGQLVVGSRETLVSRTIVKWVALKTPMKWPHGVRTLPELDQGNGRGTAPGEWSRDTEELRGWIASFADRQSFGRHAMFGAMTREDWMIWGYRHVDHHFRQFGV